MKSSILLITCLLCLLIGYSCKKDTPYNDTSVDNKTGTVIDGSNAIIDKDTEWKDVFGGDTIDYYIKTPIRIIKNAVLTIKPGVVVVFETSESGIRVEDNAGLNASGTLKKQIVLTSRHGQEGAWRGITFASNNSANKLSYARVLYAGSMKDVGYCDSIGAIVLAKNYTVKVSVTNSFIAYSGGYGIWAGSGNADLAFSKDSVLCFMAPPVAITADNMYKLDSTSYYGYLNVNYIEVAGGEIKGTDTIQRLGVAYRIMGRVYITKTLTFLPGCIVEFNKTGELTTSNALGTSHTGIINAIGTTNSHIIFRGVQPDAGSWVGITITSPGDNVLQYCEISSGGSISGYQNPSTAKGNIIVGRTGTGATATVKYCTISSSAGYGIAMFQDIVNPANSSNVYTNKVASFIDSNTYNNNATGNKGYY
jgi:hypothetical protein